MGKKLRGYRHEEENLYVCCALKSGASAGLHVWRFAGKDGDFEDPPRGSPHPWVEGVKAADYPVGTKMYVRIQKAITVVREES